MSKRLDLGAGSRCKEGYEGKDFDDFDLDVMPYPLKSNTYDKIYSRMVLEHLYNPSVLIKESHRLLKKGGELEVITTHFSHAHAFIGDIHVSTFSHLYWYCWTNKKHYPDWSYRTGNVKFSKINHKIVFGKQPLWNKLVEKWVNKSPRNQRIYEDTFLCRLFPAEETRTIYVK